MLRCYCTMLLRFLSHYKTGKRGYIWFEANHPHCQEINTPTTDLLTRRAPTVFTMDYGRIWVQVWTQEWLSPFTGFLVSQITTGLVSSPTKGFIFPGSQQILYPKKWGQGKDSESRMAGSSVREGYQELCRSPLSPSLFANWFNGRPW